MLSAMDSSIDDNMEQELNNTKDDSNIINMNGDSNQSEPAVSLPHENRETNSVSDVQWANKPFNNTVGSGVRNSAESHPNWPNNQYPPNVNEAPPHQQQAQPQHQQQHQHRQQHQHQQHQQEQQQQSQQQQQQQQQHHQQHHQQHPHQHQQQTQALAPQQHSQMVMWVETKTPEGRSYYYHAITRETTWTRPEGPNIKVVTQVEVQELSKKQHANVDKTTVGDKPKDTMGGIEAMTTQPPPNLLSQPPPNTAVATVTAPPTMQQPPLLNQPPPNVRSQPPPMFQPNMQPNYGQPPFCMPPPAYGFPPGGPAPWGMPPWNQHMHMPPGAGPVQDKPAKNLIIKPGVIDPQVIARAAEWSEHRAPDGRPYYYHAARGESVWEKPQALRDMEAARMAAHGGAIPQQQIAPPQQPPNNTAMPMHLLPNPMMHMQPVVANASYDAAMAHAAANNSAQKAANEKAAQAAQLEKEAKKAAEEKRKKEEEQKKAAAAKPVDKSRPISSTPIAGTPWCVVWTGDARVFFYNPSSRTSVWERPEELTDRKDVDKALREPPEQLRTTLQQEQATEEEKKQKAELLAKAVAPAPVVAQATPQDEDDEDDEVIKIRTESESSVEEVPTKRTRTGKSKKADASEAAVEAEQRAAKERALVPLETRITQFKEMLREKDVSAFSTWEKELHKIVFDPRYLLLTSKERKQVFEKYVRDRADEERKEKRNKMRQKVDDFRKLLEEAKLHGKSSFSEFCQRHSKDERFRSFERVRERESLFNEFIVEVRRREKEDKIHKKEQIRREFLDMLRERGDIERHTRWYDIKKKFENDPRYRAVESSVYREEYFEDYLRIIKEEKRKQRELKEQRERERERERKSDRRDKERKERDRGRERSRSRNKERRDSSREKDNGSKHSKKQRDDNSKKREVSEEGEHHDDGTDEEEKHRRSDSEEERAREERESEAERLRKERERQIRAEQSIREREKEVQRTLAGHLRDRDKEREHHKRDEAIGHFNALLTDLVRNPDFTWKEVKRQLRKDHRWDLIESLDREDREKIFNEHIDNLMKKKREKFREMLDELPTLQLTSTWKEIKKLIKEDPRYLKYTSEKGEREYRDYIKDKTLHAKTALRELLQECKFINHKSIDLIKENPNHLKEVQDILKNDKRYLVLEHLGEERNIIVMNFLEELNKRGPPPPPTASESTRRNK